MNRRLFDLYDGTCKYMITKKDGKVTMYLTAQDVWCSRQVRAYITSLHEARKAVKMFGGKVVKA